ncbi:2-methylcitrate dehydratase PrpD [Arthrobacter ginsengisoli]|uniref:2-methylcitrate dehydratase PrpD n=1 Tax=Arthrobacter ginsengisoli TaxID=1356565 RepID=A0ABU1UHF1_9MICC|nr:MmgE/PrpD family protein [Arthrobacter ginsengisoli]MDR7084555.1 2-methylcitrate dehydratase PrpD [Arthrobacter ginsengisoli]
MQSPTVSQSGANELESAEKPLLTVLAEFAHSLEGDAIPSAVRDQAKLCLLDTLGCIIAGSVTAEAAALQRAERRLSSGSGVLLSPSEEARVLGYMGDVLELNDLIGGHASIGIVAAVIGAARQADSSGEQVVDAIVAGIEVTSRLYESTAWTKKPYTESGMVIPSLVSAIGAAAAVARLRGLSVAMTAEAMGIAGTIVSWGPAEVIFGTGGTIKPILFGACPADSGIKGVEYALAGLTGPPHLIESPLGLMAALSHSFDESEIRSPDVWHLLKPQRKLHASCGYTHSSIDAVVDLVRQGVNVAEAKQIKVQVPEYLLAAVRKDHMPETPNEARFHLQYCLALAANGADFISPAHTLEFERYASPEIESLMERIEVSSLEISGTIHAKPYNISRVTIEGNDGKIVEGGCNAPRGSAANPLTDDDVLQKFRRLASARMPDTEIESGISLIQNLARPGNDKGLWAIIDDILEADAKAS